MRRRSDLRKYQIRFVNLIKRIPGLILALPMGSGKSAISLTASVDMLDDKEIRRILVVAPLNVATGTWPDEIEEWEHTRDLDYLLIRAEDNDPDIVQARKDAVALAKLIGFETDSKKLAAAKIAKLLGFTVDDVASFAAKQVTKAKEWKRIRLASEEHEIHIINREILPWLWEFFGRGKHWPYDLIIVDEASMFRNGKMRTPTKALTRFGAMAKARKITPRVLLLTGTPAPKGLANLWGLAYIADLGERLGTSRFQFENRWFDKDFMGWNMEPKPRAEVQIMDRLSDIMYSMKEEDCVNLPPMIPISVKVSLSPRVMAEYKRFEQSLFSERYDVEAVNRGVLHNKLLQFANGSLYRDVGQDVWIHDEKLEALEQIIEDANGAPVLVAYSFKFDLKRIRKAFRKAVVFGEGDIRKTKARWNNGEIDLMLAHPASIGHGQNIQKGGWISTWYGLTSDLELYLQFNKRLHRSGQTRTVFNHHIIAEGTLDERMLPLLTDRNADQDRIIDAVRIPLLNRR